MLLGLANLLGLLQPWKPLPPNPYSRKLRGRAKPGQGRGRAGIGEQRMHVEEFLNKAQRDARFSELRAQKTPHVTKFSTIHGNETVWCVVRP